MLLPMSLAAGLELKQQPTLLEARQPVVEGKLRSKLTIANVSYPANDPIEDRWDFRDYDGKTFAAVMDGHGGWQAADFAQRELLATVGKELDNCSNVGVPGQVADAMARAYKRVDRAFLHSVKPAFEQGFGDVAKVGCCAITAAVLPSAVVVANAGDCRSVQRQPVTAPRRATLDGLLTAGTIRGAVTGNLSAHGTGIMAAFRGSVSNTYVLQRASVHCLQGCPGSYPQ